MSQECAPFLYSCYGLSVKSDIEIPEFLRLNDDSEAADVVVRMDRVTEPPPPVGRSGLKVAAGTERTHFFWDVAGHYVVEGGRSIRIDPVPDAEPDLYRLPLLGIVFAALLAQRGLQVLHGSAVSTPHGAVGLIGEKGMGKSTTAAALHHSGHQAIADDVVAISHDGMGAELLPAFPHLKLWPQALDHLGDQRSTHQLHSRVTKRGWLIDGSFPRHPVNLRRLYLLEWGDETRAESVSPGEAFAGIVPHTFASRYAPDDVHTRRHLLHSITSLLRAVPVRRLIRRPDLARLSDVVQAVENDLASEAVAAAAVAENHQEEGTVAQRSVRQTT